MKSICKNELVKLISVCGQIAEHKGEKMAAHNIDDSELLMSLSTEECIELERLLNKLKTNWFEDHKRRMMEKKFSEN